MNPIIELRAQKADAEAALEQHTNKYYWLKGYGTGWCGAHYGISEDEYDASYDRCVELRGRIIALDKEITQLRSRARRKLSLVAHRRAA